MKCLLDGIKVAAARPGCPEGSAKIPLRFMAVPERYAFAEFMLDVTERRLSRDGHPISLEPKTHDVLVVLLRRAGRLVTKRELLDLVWPESFVEDGILTVHVSTLRKALRTGAPREVHRNRAPVGIPLCRGRHETEPRWRRGSRTPGTQRPRRPGESARGDRAIPRTRGVRAVRARPVASVGRVGTSRYPRPWQRFERRSNAIPRTPPPTRAWRWPVARRPSFVPRLSPNRSTRPEPRPFARWR